MHGKLVYVSKNGEEKEELPVINLHFFIGSDLFCDLRIKHKDIAAQHCLITSQKDKPALIRNLSRTVPTLVNNTEIGTADVELKDQDIIAIRHKHFKWRYNDSSETSTSYASFGATSKNRKSWPFFKNKLVAVVTPQRRDEDVQVTESIQLGISQKEAPPKRRRGTIGGHISSSKKPSSPKVLAVKSGLKATHKQSFRKRKSDVKNAQPTRYVESTSQSFPSSSSKKKVKFLDTSLPRSRLGKRGQKRSITTPYKGTPTRRKVSVYSTPPSTLRYGRLRPVKSILKTPGSSSSTSSVREHDQKLSYLAVPNLGSSPDVTLLSEVSEGSSPVLLENDVLRTPPKVDQPDVVMRSSRRKAAIIRSPKSTPKSATKKRKSLEEKSLEASERAAKQLKRGPPHAIDKKKRAALLQCHRKSLTPHPEARKCGKLITRFPPTFRSELKTASPQLSNMRKSEPLIFSTAVPKVFRFSSLEEPVSTEAIPAKSSATSREDIKQKKKSLSKSASKVLSTSPIVQKFTRASRAANALREWQQRAEVDDVLSALDLSRRWPPSQGLVNTNTSSQVDVSNLTGIKKLFCIDKTLDAKDVRELFLETSTDKSAQNLPEEHSENMSRHSALSAMSSSGCKEGSSLFNSFHSEGAPELPCSKSLLSGSSLSVPSYSSTSRRSLSLKKGRTSTSSPVRTASPIKDITLKSTGQSIEKKSRRNRDIQGTPSNTRSCKSRPKSNVQSIHLVEKDDVEELLNSDVSYISSISDQTCKSREGDNNQFLTCSSVQEKCPKNNFSGFNSSFSGKSSSYLDISSPFSDDRCGSYCKNRSSNSLSLMQVSGVHKIDEDTSLKHSVKIESSIHASQYEKFSPIYRKSHHKGRVSLRQVILKASTPKPEKISLVNETFLSLAEKVRPIKKKKLTVDEMSLSAVKKRSCSLPSSGDPATPTQDVSKIDVIKSTGKRRGRPSKLSYVANESSPDNPDLVVTRTSHSKSPIKNKNSIPNQTKVMFVDSEKHKRLPTTSVGGEATEVEMSTSAVKKHSHSLQSSAGDATTPKQGITKIDLSTGRRRGRPSKLGTLANESSSDISSVVHSRNSSSNPIKDKNSTHDQSEAMSVDSFMSEKRLLTSVSSGAKEGDTATPKQDILKTDVMSSGKRGRLSKLSNVFNESSPDVSAVDVAGELCSNSSITPNQQGAMSIYSIRSEKKSRLSAISVGSGATENEMSRSAVKKRSRSLSSLVDDTKTQQDISKINVSTGRRRGRPSKLSTMVNESSPDIPSIALTRTSHSKSSIKNKTSTQNQTDAMSVDSIMFEIGDTATPKQDISKIDESMKRRRGRPSKLSTVLNEPLPDVPVVAVTKNSRSKSSIDNIRSEKIRQSTTSESSRTTKGEISTSAVKKRSRSLPSSVGDTAAPKHDVSKIDESMKRRRGRPSKLTTVLNESSPDVPVVAVTRNSRSKSSISIMPDHPGAMSIESFRSEKSSRLSTNSLGGSATKGEMSKSAVKKRSHSLPSSVVDTATPKQDISKIDESIKRRRGRPSKLSTVINEPSPDVPVVAVTRNSRNKSSITPDHPEAMFIESFMSEKSSRLSTNSVGGRATKGEISTSAVKKRSHSLPSSVDDTAAPKQDISKIDESMKRRRGRPSKLSTVINEPSPDVPVVAVTRNSRNKSSITPDHPEAMFIESFRSEKSSRLSTNSVGSRGTKGEISTSAVKKRSHSLPSSVDDTAAPKQDISKIDESMKRRRGRPSKLSTVINEPSPDVPVVAVTRNSRNKSSITPDHPEAMFIESFRSEKSSRLSTNSVGSRGTKGEISTSAVKKRSHSLPSSVDDTAAPKQDISKIDESMKRRRGRPSKLSTVINEPSPDVPVVAVTRNSRNKSSITPDHPEAMFIESFRSEKSSRLSTNSVGSRGTKGEISTSAVKKRSCSLLSSVGDTAFPKQDISKIDESMKRRRGRPSKLSTVLNEFSPNVSVVSVTRNSRSKSSIDNIRSEKRNRLSTNSVGSRATTGEMSTSAVKKRSLSLPSSIGDTVTIKQDISKIDESMKRRRGRPSKLSTVLNEPSPDVPVVAVTRNSRNKSSITPDHPKAMFIESFRSEKSSRLSTNSVGGRATKGEISTSAEKKRFHSFGSSIGDTTTPKQDISKIYDIKSMGKRRGKTSKFSTVINDSSPDIPSMTLARTSHIKSSANDKNTTPNLAKAMSVGSGTTKGEMSTSGVKKRSRSLPSSVGDPATPKEDILKIDVIKSTGKRRGRPSKLSYVANESSPVHPALAVTRTSHSKSPIKNKNRTSDLADALPVNKHLDFLQGDISSHVKESTSESVNWFSFSNSLVDSSCKTAEYATSSVGRHSLPYRDVTVNNLVPLSSSVPQIIRKGIRSRKIKFNPEFISPSQKVKNSKNHDIYKSKPLVSLGTSINRNKGNSSCSFSKSQQASSSTSFEIYDCNSHAISSNSSVVHSALETGTLGQVESGQVSTCRVTRSTSLSSGKLTPSDMVVSTSPKGREHSDGGSRPSQPLLPTVNPNSSEKSRKRKLTVEASLIPDSQSCGSCILDNSMSPIKKRLQTEETIFIQEASNKINKNKRSTWLGPSLKSKKLPEYETFSSTPLLPENSSVFSSSIIRKLRKSKHSTFQSPVGISPIVNNDKYTSSISDNSAVSMVALPATELPGKVGKSDKRSFFASNMLHKTILTDDASEIKSLALTPVSSNKIHSQSTRSPTRRLTRLQRSLVESRNPVDMNYSNKFSEVSVKDGLIKSPKSSLIEKNRTGCNGSSLEEPKISIASHNNVNGSTNKSLLLGTQSLRHSGIDFNDIVNKSTNKLKAESSTKTALISPSVQPGLPLTTIGLPITKENKSIHKELQSHDVLAICEKDEKPKLDKTERLSTNLIPVVKLSPVKRRTRTSKIPKEIESPTKKKPKPINVAKSFLVEEIIASPSATSNKLLRKRKVIKEESVSESGVEPHADKKKRTRGKEKPTDIPSIDSPPKTRKGRSANLASALAENDKVHSGGISTTRGSRLKQTANMSPQDIPARKKAVAKVMKSKDAYTPGDSFSKDGMNVNTLQMEGLPKGVGKGRNGRLIINRVLKGNEMEEKSIVLSAKSTLPQRRKRVAKVEKEIYEVAKNSPFTQKQGKSSKNDKLNIRPEKPKDIPSLQNIALRNKKGEKTANIELFINDESSNKKEVETLLVIQDEPRASLRGRHGKIINRPAQKIGSEKNSPGASSKTRSHVAVVVLKTQKKGTRAVISSPIVRSSPQLRRGRSNKINLKTQKLLNESTLSKPGRLGKETTANSTIDKQKATANSTKDEQNASQNNVSTKKRGRNYERPKIVKDNTKITTGELVNEGRPNRFVNESRPSRFEQKSVTRSSALALRSGKSVMRGFHEQALSPDVPKKGRSGEKDLDGNCRVDETKPLSVPPIKRRGRSATRKENVNSSSLGGSIIDSKAKPVPHAQEGGIRAAVEAQSGAVIPKKRGRPAGKTKQSVEVPKAVTAQRRGRSANQRQVDESTVAFSKPPARKVTSQHPIHCPEETSVSESNEGKMSKRKLKKAQSIASSENIFPAVVRKTRALQNRSSINRKLDIAAKQKPSKNQLPSDKKSAVRETLKVSQQSKVKVTNIKVGDKKPLKSAIKKVIRVSSAGAKVKRLSSRKSRFDVIKKAVHFKPQGVKKSKIKRK